MSGDIIHQDDGSGHCTACGTVWPTECIAERHAVWVAESAVNVKNGSILNSFIGSLHDAAWEGDDDE